MHDKCLIFQIFRIILKQLVAKGILRQKRIQKIKWNTKARQVVKGFTQHERIDFDTYHLFLAKTHSELLCAGCTFWFSDGFKIAFLNNHLFEELDMFQPKGFEKKSIERMVYRLKKSSYDLMQVSRQWFLRLDKIVTFFDFK